MNSRNRFSSLRQGKNRRFDFEKLEDRNLLSGTSGLVHVDMAAGHETELLNYLASNQETQYLQTGINGLQFVEVKANDTHTHTTFRQTIHGLPVHGFNITVIQDNASEVQDVVVRSFDGPLSEAATNPSVGLNVAQQVANQTVDGNAIWSTNGELVWFVSQNSAELAWEVQTSVRGLNGNTGDFDFTTVVDASDASMLSQSQAAPDAIAIQQGIENGINPRIVINDTIGPAGSQAYAADPIWRSIVQVNNGCTGTLIAPNAVIGARHCGTSAGAPIDFGIDSNNPDFTATVESVSLPAGPGTLLDGGDVEIIILTEDVPSSVAEPMRFIDATDELEGMLAATLGYGLNGVGSTGHQGSSDGIRWGGENIIDVYGTPAAASGANIISTDFDDGSAGANTIPGSDPMPIEFEATTAPGDSGGAIWVQQGGEWLIAGVLSGGTNGQSLYSDISWWTGTAIYKTQIEEAGGVFGSTSGDVDVMVDGDSIPTGTEFDFGVTSIGDSITKDFIVRNTDETPLTLNDDLTVLGNRFTLVSGFGETTLEQDESVTVTVRFDATALGSFDGLLTFTHSDNDENPMAISLKGSVAGTIGEAGLLQVSNRWQTVNLNNTYHDPVVVAGPVSSNEADPAVVRIRNITPDSFQIRVQEWQYLDGPHINERISFTVMERGVHRLQTGQTVVAGKVDGVNTTFSSELFALPFDETPVVIASSNTYNGGAPITTRLHNVTQTGFQVMVQEEEAADNKHNDETIGYLAFLQEEGTLGGLKMDSERTGFDVDEDQFTLSLDGGFIDPPVFLATMQTTIGTNTASLRMTDITNSTATVFVEEEQSRDVEVGHGNEVVGFLALEEGDLLGTTAVGEAFQVTADRDWQTVNLDANYIDPVVIASSNTFNESDPMTIRIRNVTSNSFEMHVEEWNYLDLDHAPETVSVMVFESGIHQLRDGTLIEARNSRADLNWTEIELTRDYGAEAPAIFTQLSSVEGPATATVRTRNVTTDSFEILVQEEEANKDGHVEETVSWVAVHAGAGFTGGQQYDVMLPATGANHKGATYTFDAAFNRAPVTIASMQTSFGTNTATVRQTEVTRTDLSLFIEEEQSFDSETGHGREQIGFFAVDAGTLDGVLLEFFDDNSDGGVVIPPLGGFRSISPPVSNVDDVQQMLSSQLDVAILETTENAGRVEMETTVLSPLAGSTELLDNSQSTVDVHTTLASPIDSALSIGELDKAFETLS